jgi:hypothetical protein
MTYLIKLLRCSKTALSKGTFADESFSSMAPVVDPVKDDNDGDGNGNGDGDDDAAAAKKEKKEKEVRPIFWKCPPTLATSILDKFTSHQSDGIGMQRVMSTQQRDLLLATILAIWLHIEQFQFILTPMLARDTWGVTDTKVAETLKSMGCAVKQVTGRDKKQELGIDATVNAREISLAAPVKLPKPSLGKRKRS